MSTFAPSVGVPALAGGAPVRDRFLVFGAPLIGDEEIAEVVDTLRSGWIGFGPKCIRLEEAFGRYVGSPCAVSLASCTAGLYLALREAGVGQGDEVITSPLTFVATANVIEHLGARPIFVDVRWDTQNIDPELVDRAVTPRTRAIVPVHMAGRPCDMDAIGDIAKRHRLIVVEDAAHAIESAWDGKKIGSISEFTVFSFYATKNLTTAEGGMLTTKDEAAAERLRVARLHGLSKDAWKRYSSSSYAPYDTLEPGFKFNLTDLQASLGLHQLARIEENLTIRERHWAAYDQAFAELPEVEVPSPPGPKERHARHLYTLLLRLERLSIDRQGFMDALKAENIGSGVHFVPVHEHSYYRNKYGYDPGAFPNAEGIGERTVSLPLSAALSDSDVEDVIAAVSKVAAHYGR